MCKLTESGYELKSGKIIPFHNCKLELLSSEEFAELSGSKASILDTLLIRDALHGLRTDMQTVINKIDSFCDARKEGCPANEEKIKEIAQQVVDNQPKRVYNKVVEISKSFGMILILVINIILLYNLIK